jgi:tungstate transport system substrate-binding protein
MKGIRTIFTSAITVALTACALPTQAPAAPTTNLRLATTTSIYETGLLTYLLPGFEKQAGVKVEVVSVGTGQALKLGEDGNVDVVLVHARAQEDAFMKAEHGVRREDVMYDDFVVLGPKDDPSGVKSAKTTADAFKAIATRQTKFISRGDESGTHTKELEIWKTAMIEPKGAWYQSVGQGMGAVLNMADEQLAYTLSDRGTYLARLKTGTQIVIVFEGEKGLFNPYGVLAVNPAKNKQINHHLANKFIDWLIAVETQTKIADFGVAEFGQPLFAPDSRLWRERK